MNVAKWLLAMGSFTQAAGAARDDRKEQLCSSWRGTLWKALYVVYAILAAICVMDSLVNSAPEQTVLLKTVRFVVQFWSLGLIACLCRTRLTSWASKVAAAFASVLSAAANTAVRGAGQGGHQPRRAETTAVGHGAWFQYVSCEMQGWRPSMEDKVVCCAQLKIPQRPAQGQDGQQSQQNQDPSSGSFSPFSDFGQRRPADESKREVDAALASGAAIFAVFDGHGGSEVSGRASDRLVEHVLACLETAESTQGALKNALLEVEDHLDRSNLLHGRWNLMGCTAAVALLGRDSLTVASVGDSRVFKCRNGRVVPLTRDHKPESPRERRRIEAAGGNVAKFGPCYRVDFGLNMSRALGDFQFKDPSLPPEQQKISPVPDVTTIEIDDQDEFLVVACDGLFELMTWETVCEYIHKRIRTSPLAQIAEGLLDACCSPNIMATGGRGTDNESVIIVKLPGASPSSGTDFSEADPIVQERSGGGGAGPAL